jgi:hypothetical protein
MNSRFTDDSLHWRKLCRAASLEQDPDNLLKIVQKMNAALKTRMRKLRTSLESRRDNASHLFSRVDRAA